MGGGGQTSKVTNTLLEQARGNLEHLSDTKLLYVGGGRIKIACTAARFKHLPSKYDVHTSGIPRVGLADFFTFHENTVRLRFVEQSIFVRLRLLLI